MIWYFNHLVLTFQTNEIVSKVTNILFKDKRRVEMAANLKHEFLRESFCERFLIKVSEPR